MKKNSVFQMVRDFSSRGRKRSQAEPTRIRAVATYRRDQSVIVEEEVCGVQSANPDSTHINSSPTHIELHTAHPSRADTVTEAATALPEALSIQVLELIENIDTDSFLVELGFTDVNGCTKRCCVPRSDLDSPNKVRRLLVDKGAVLSSTAKDDLGSLQHMVPTTHRKVTGRAGWHGQDCFVLPRATYGNDRSLSFDLRSGNAGQSSRGLARGTLENWKAGLRKPLFSSSYLTFVTSLGFAAPIAALLDMEETAVFHTFGESNAGKTLMQKVAASILGRAQERDLVSFNQTRAGLNDVMAELNGTLIPLNEMKTAEATNDLKSSLVDLAHVLTSGVGRNRSKYAQRDPDLAHRTWKAFGITNKEHSLKSMANGKRDMGERARFIDLPVPPVSKGGIFDRLDCDEDELPEVTRNLAEQVTRTIEENYGVAFPPFIAHLVEKRETVLRRFKEDTEYFVDKYAPDDNWERRYARKFGYAYAGGLAAVRAGVMPCSRGHVIVAVHKLYRAARACFKADADMTRRALKKLLGAMGDDRRFPRVEKDERVPDDFARACWGFRRHYPELGACLGIPSERLQQWEVSDEAFRRIVEELKKAGAHVPGRDKAGLTHSRELRGGGRRRYILLRLPALRKMWKASRATA